MRWSAARAGWRDWGPFALLCVITASRWVFIDAVPETSSTLRTEAWGCALAAVIAGVAAGVRRAPFLRGSAGVRLAGVGAGLLAAPAFGAALRGPAGESFNRTVALCFVPLMVLVWNGVRADAEMRMTIWPGLAGLGAALLLFPLVLPSNVWGYVGLLAPALAVSAAIVFARGEELRGWGAATLFAGGAGGLALMEWGRMLSRPDFTQSTHWQGVLIDAAVAWLVMLSVRGLDSLRYASRYFLVPLLTIVEGLVLLRQGASFRFWAGLILMLGAAVSLWRQRRVDDGGLHLT